MSKYVVEGEWLEAILENISLDCPPQFEGIPPQEPEPCDFYENGNPKIGCMACWVKYGGGAVIPLTEAQERAGDEEGWVVANLAKLREKLGPLAGFCEDNYNEMIIDLTAQEGEEDEDLTRHRLQRSALWRILALVHLCGRMCYVQGEVQTATTSTGGRMSPVVVV